MFEIDFEPKQKVKIFGKEYELSKPTTKQASDFLSNLEEAGNSTAKQLDCMMSMMEKLGLPKEVSEQIPAGKYKDLVDHVVVSKKN